MTYNVQFDQIEDGNLFGVQEALPQQVTDLKGALPAFDEYGIGRDDSNNQDKFNIIF